MLGPSREVVAVQGPAPREHVDDAKARGCSRLDVVLDEEADHAVPLWALDRVDTLDENRLRADVRPELEHRLIDKMGRPRLKLLDHPPIWDIDFPGLMKPAWLIRWPSSLRHTAVSITRPRWPSDTPDRMRSRSGVSCREDRHVRPPPSARSRLGLQGVHNAWPTVEIHPTPPG